MQDFKAEQITLVKAFPDPCVLDIGIPATFLWEDLSYEIDM
jgi:hypothetical protein